MKKDIHPNYRKVLFKDITTDQNFIVSSSVDTTETASENGVAPIPKVKIIITIIHFVFQRISNSKFNQKYKKK